MTTVLHSLEVQDLLFGYGLNIRTPVRAATVVNGTIETSFEAGDVIDDVTLVAGDRILLAKQTTQTQNGIYVVQNSGAPIRSEDMKLDSNANLFYVFVREGTLNANTAWICTSPVGTDVVGTDNLFWDRAGGAGAVTIASTVVPVNNAIARFDGTDGDIQESTVILDDVGNLNGLGNLTFDGATFDLTVIGSDQTVGVANATIPDLAGVSDTFAMTTLAQTLSNKTLSSPTITGNVIFDKATNDLTLAVTDQATGPATATIIDLGGVNADFLFNNRPQTITNKTFGDALNMGNFKITNLATPTVATDAANKAYVDSVASGLDPKESCRFTTFIDIAATYNSTGGTGGTGEFTGVDLTDGALFDLNALTVIIGDRILIKDQTDPKENGIYVVTTDGATGVIERAPDQDGDPPEEVSGGNYTFIEQGAAYENAGFILQGDGVLTLNVDDLVWVQYTGAGQIIAGDGLLKTGNVLDVRVTNVSLGIASDFVVVRSTNTTGQVLRSTGVAGVEATWGALNLASTDAVTGTLPVGNGGTGATTFTSGNLIQGNGTSALSSTAIATVDVLTTTNTKTVTNKAFEDDTTTFFDEGDNTKIFKFDASGITASTTRTLTIPDFNTTLVGTDATQTLSNKILTQPRFVDLGFIADASGNEMLLFDSIASAVNYAAIENSVTTVGPTISARGDDTNIDLQFQAKGTGKFAYLGTAGNAATVRLFENTGNGSNYVGLKAPEAVTTDVTFTLPGVDGSTADSVLVTDAAGVLSFKALASIRQARAGYSIMHTQTNASNTTLTSISYFAWDDSEYNTTTGTVAKCILWYTSLTNRALNADIYDGTTSLGSVTVPAATADGIATFTFTRPSTDVMLQFRIRKTTGGGTNPIVFAAQIEFTTT